MTTTSQVGTVKEEVLALIQSLPDNVSLHEIMDHLYMKARSALAEQEEHDGKVVEEQEAEARIRKWIR
jgi:hypothetical protein